VGFWEQLNTFKISSNPGTQIQKQSDPLHLEEDNQDLLKSVKLVNDATLRSDGGPIPATQVLEQTILVNNGSDESDRTVVFTPQKGEVWSLDLASALRSGGSGTVVHQLYLADKATGNVIRWYYFSTADSDVIFTSDTNWPDMPFFFDENFTLQYLWNGGSSITNFTFQCICHRVR
jgi:hypothetical protein